MKKKLIGYLINFLCLYLGTQLFWSPAHPSRDVVREVGKEVEEYYATHKKIPQNLDFIDEPKLGMEIKRLSIKLNMDEGVIDAAKFHYPDPDLIYILTFGLFGDNEIGGMSHGYELQHIPNEELSKQIN